MVRKTVKIRCIIAGENSMEKLTDKQTFATIKLTPVHLTPARAVSVNPFIPPTGLTDQTKTDQPPALQKCLSLVHPNILLYIDCQIISTARTNL